MTGPWGYDKHDDPKVFIDPKLLQGQDFDDFVERFGDRFFIELHDIYDASEGPRANMSVAYAVTARHARLIAEAPALKAEVEQLRELVQRVAESADDCESYFVVGKDEWDALWKAVSE